MKRAGTVWPVILILAVSGGLIGCGESDVDSTSTSTISPVTPEPVESSEPDPALTTTVEIDENRSANEGADIIYDDATEGSPPPATATRQ